MGRVRDLDYWCFISGRLVTHCTSNYHVFKSFRYGGRFDFFERDDEGFNEYSLVSVGAVADSTSIAISLWGGMQHFCRNKTGTDSKSLLTVSTEH